MLSILAWIIVGGIAGWLASLVVKGGGSGILGNVVVGVLGAIIGGAALSFFLPGSFSFTGFNIASLLIAFIGAVILLLIIKLFTGSRRRAA